MSENNPKANEGRSGSDPETQKERWLKYGGNVVLSIVVVVAASVLAIYLGQHWHEREDTTAGHSHSLSAATVDLIHHLPSKIKLVSLYTKAKRDDDSGRPEASAAAALHYREVADLLEEYQRKGSNINVEIIDPYAEPGKLQQLVDEVTKTYGNNVERYREALADFSKTVDDITRQIDQEAKALKNVPSSRNEGLRMTMALLRQTVDAFPEDLRDLQSTLPAELKKANPDYKLATDAARAKLGDLSRNLQGMIDGFKKQDSELTPLVKELEQSLPATTGPAATQPSADRQNLETFKIFLAYAHDSEPRYEKIKKETDDLIGRLGNLGELKQLNDLQSKKTDSIVVMGDKDMVVIPRERVYLAPPKGVRSDTDRTDPVRFAGEQQISTAMLVLAEPKRPRVAFIRSGGFPTTVHWDNISVGQYQGPYTGSYFALAEKLRGYNFDIVERDLSEQWALHSQELRQSNPELQVPPEATDEQLKDAVWVMFPGEPTPPEMVGRALPNMSGQKLSEHLEAGGSAMLLFSVQDDNLMQALTPYGVTVYTNRAAMHDRPPETEGRVVDEIDNFRREQLVFVVDHYGDHPITTPMQSLESILYPALPITTIKAEGFTTTNLLPLMDGPLAVWAKDIRNIRRETNHFDSVNDMSPPLTTGVAVEKTAGKSGDKGGVRLVVTGCAQLPANQWITLRERDVRRGGSNAARFPGNTEFMTNSIFWLSKMEKMMSIAPASRDAALIASVSPAGMMFWRGTILLFVPVIILVIGAKIYFARRD